jgi:hypothetical protein
MSACLPTYKLSENRNYVLDSFYPSLVSIFGIIDRKVNKYLLDDNLIGVVLKTQIRINACKLQIKMILSRNSK